ncbi:MAG TPA: M1 family aminopeptidase [Thermoanaerobaculia bacterium]|jgi:ABC-type transport system involved in multi-copper enzyme maturation permease subunit|nr:M1 family aminopeptidase [Thermoanaerobaculia bacterium]
MSKNFREIFRFELHQTLRSPLFWGTGLFFATMTFGAVTSDSITIGGGIGNVQRNAPFVILQLLSVMSVIGVFVTTAFVAGAALRDFERGTHELFFSKPMAKLDYLGGRFAGSLVASTGVMVLCSFGILIGSFMPWLEAERIGPTLAAPYLFALGVLVIPNLLLTGALFFALASASRSWLVTYVGVVVFFAGFFVSTLMLADVEHQTLSALLDPFGATAINVATRYWTVTEKNTALPPLSGLLLWNRLIWTGVGGAVLALSFATFRASAGAPTYGALGRLLRRRKKVAAVPALAEVGAPTLSMPHATRDFSSRRNRSLFFHALRRETIGVWKSIPFVIMVAFGMFNLAGSSVVRFERFGTKVYPVTALMLDNIQGSFLFLLVIILTLYAGELVWRERALKVAEVTDALPVPSWVPLLSKIGALWIVILTFLTVGGLTAMGIQLSQGYSHLEPGLYAKGLAIAGVRFLLAAVLAVFFQVMCNQKFVGYLAMILFLISQTVLGAMNFDHRLYRFADVPPMTYSDMNGYGHYLQGFAWFNLYWACFALLLLVGAALFWVRGSESVWQLRLREAKARFRGPWRALAAAGLVGWVAVGAWIFWNTNVLNAYVPTDEQEHRQADYEKQYRKYKDLVAPRIVDAEANVDIFPGQRRVEIAGRYVLKNKSNRPESAIHLQLDPRVKVRRLSLDPKWRTHFDQRLGYSIYQLPVPLAPGATMELSFQLTVEEKGFVNQNSDTSLVYNGTFFNNGQYFPVLAYDESRQLQDRNDRRKYGLPPAVRMAKLEDLNARRNNYISGDADWIGFRATVSTSADQIALAPGYLQREWTVGNRRYFRYEMDRPILNFYSFLSARWAVKKDVWHPGKENVAIEIYYDPAHAYNVDRMIDSAKKSLDYFTVAFSPYQHHQVRILEFPRYASFAQSFPNTIPYSESIGFIADLRDPEDIDYVFYVTAHEVAHQWWAHQVIGGAVQGGTMLSESLAQYSALMVMQKEYGKVKMRRFLKYELDQYLEGRGGELIEEMPLMRVENQPYIHYRKGSLVFYALQEAIGEETVNRALSRYVAQVAFQEPPYTYTPDLLKILREVTPPGEQKLLHDLFETITLYDTRATTATWTRRADGKYLVKLTVEAKKMRADGKGVESPLPLDDSIDIGVFGETKKDSKKQETVLYLAKHRLTQPTSTFELVVGGKPVEAGIDPLNKLVDRTSDDNRTKVTEAGSA